ncbi:hypothetical protein ACO0QE_000978 [Hanseniaspora vineae]
MKVKRTFDAIFLFFLLGAGLLTFFLILSGARTTGTLTNFYWLKADTSGIGSANSETYWTNYMACGKSGSDFTMCSGKQPAYPFSPRDNFPGSNSQLPGSFVNHRDTYYYLSRVGWAMLLVGLFFEAVTIIPNLLALCLDYTAILICSSVFIWFAWFFITLAACLLTSAFVKGKNAFHDSGRSAHLGVKNFAFIWTSVFLLTICAIWHPISATLTKEYNVLTKRNKNRWDEDKEYDQQGAAGVNNGDYYGRPTGAFNTQTTAAAQQPVQPISRQTDYAGFTSSVPQTQDNNANQPVRSGTTTTNRTFVAAGGMGPDSRVKANPSDPTDDSTVAGTGALNVPFQNKDVNNRGDHSYDESGEYYDDDDDGANGDEYTTDYDGKYATSPTTNPSSTTAGGSAFGGNGGLKNPIKITRSKKIKKRVPGTDKLIVTNVEDEAIVLPK